MRTERPMVFVRRAATVALLTFASALAGFGVHGFLPANYVVESRSMVGSVVGLVASLLSLVLSLLIWTSHGLFTTQQSQLQAVGRSIIQLDFALTGYGSEATQGRALLSRRPVRRRAGNAQLFSITAPYKRRTKTRYYERERPVRLDRRHANDDRP